MNKGVKIDLFLSMILVFIIIVYVLATLLNISKIELIGKYFLIIFMFLVFLLLIKKKFFNHVLLKKELVLFFPYLLLILIYLLNLNNSLHFNGFMIVFNHLAYFLIVYVIYSVFWTNSQIRYFSYLYYLTLPILLILIFRFTNIYNTNKVGAYIYFLSFFHILEIINKGLNNKKSYILLTISITLSLVFITDTRSILLGSFFGLITFILWKYITRKKAYFNLYFFLILLLIFVIIIVYPNLHKWQYFRLFNDLVLKYTGKPIHTGRNTIWAQLLKIIMKKPWLGYGTSIVASDFLKTSLSAHNLYLQICLQTGLIGITCFILFLSFIWKSFWTGRKNPKVILTSCFFISIVIYQTFEITLTQNQFCLGLIQWMIIALGLNFSLNDT